MRDDVSSWLPLALEDSPYPRLKVIDHNQPLKTSCSIYEPFCVWGTVMVPTI